MEETFLNHIEKNDASDMASMHRVHFSYIHIWGHHTRYLGASMVCMSGLRDFYDRPLLWSDVRILLEGAWRENALIGPMNRLNLIKQVIRMNKRWREGKKVPVWYAIHCLQDISHTPHTFTDPQNDEQMAQLEKDLNEDVGILLYEVIYRAKILKTALSKHDQMRSDEEIIEEFENLMADGKPESVDEPQSIRLLHLLRYLV